jgi:hypothetical protein
MRRPRLAGAMAVLVSTATVVACGDDASGSREVTVREPVVVGTGEFTNYNTSIAAGGPKGEVVTVVWNDYDDVQVVERPFVVTSADGGAIFSKPVLIDPDDPYLAYPDLAVDDAGTIFAAVTRYADGDATGGRPCTRRPTAARPSGDSPTCPTHRASRSATRARRSPCRPTDRTSCSRGVTRARAPTM